MLNTDTTAARARAALDELTARAHELAGEGRDTLSSGAERARRVPEAFGRAAHQVGDAARRGWDGARQRVDTASERTADYIQHEPVRSVLVAAAAGAVVALLIGALTYRSRERRWR